MSDQGPAIEIGAYPALIQLGLTKDDLRCLANQGHLNCDSPSSKPGRWKLRFRYQGQQKVRYVRHALVEDVRREIATLQKGKTDEVASQQLIRTARMFLREMKSKLQAAVEAEGYHFHGLRVRKTRPSNFGPVDDPK